MTRRKFASVISRFALRAFISPADIFLLMPQIRQWQYHARLQINQFLLQLLNRRDIASKNRV
jgi:hypothetical protein